MFSNDYPRTWSEMSFEYKGMFAYHIAMMVMIVAGWGLAFIHQIVIAAAIMLAIAVVSVIRRVWNKWRWRGITAVGAGRTVLMIGLMGFFLFAVFGGAMQAQGFSFDRPFGLGPFLLAAAGIAVFSVLNSVGIAHIAEKAFQEECGDQALQARTAAPPEPRWKVITKRVFTVAFIAVWLEAVTFFYIYDRTVRSSSPTPTAEQSVALKNKGETHYITPAEMHLIDLLRTIMFIGIPSAMAASLFVHFVLKIRFEENR